MSTKTENEIISIDDVDEDAQRHETYTGFEDEPAYESDEAGVEAVAALPQERQPRPLSYWAICMKPPKKPTAPTITEVVFAYVEKHVMGETSQGSKTCKFIAYDCTGEACQTTLWHADALKVRASSILVSFSHKV